METNTSCSYCLWCRRNSFYEIRKKIYFILIVFTTFFYIETSFAREEKSSCYLGKNEVILESGKNTFIVSSMNKEEIIKIRDFAGILCYYRFMNKPEEKFIITGSQIKSSSILKDDEQEKSVEVIFQPSVDIKLKLLLSIKKGYDVLFVKYFLQNTGSSPLSIGIEWFTNFHFKKYIAINNQLFDIPETVGGGVDMTQGLMGKTNWQSIGISPYDKWIYLLPDESIKRGLGIIIDSPDNDPVFFGIRGDKLVYWGEKRCVLEEGENVTHSFILLPSESPLEFKEILPKLGMFFKHS